jgi:hypothetical protein
MYTPRLAFEIMAELVARVVSTSRVLTDLSEGSVLGSILGSVAEEVSAVERRIQEFIDAYYLRGVGANLDRRLRDFPAGFPKRRQATPATGGAFRIVRSTTAGTTSVAARGMLVAVSNKQPQVVYTNSVPFAIGSGATTAINVPFVALTPGEASNLAQPGMVDTILRGVPEIVEVTNTLPMQGGTDRERDSDLRARAERWVASLALAQPEALEAVALNFQGVDGTVLRHAAVWRDPDMPGYSELVVDDGTGMVGYTRTAATYSGTLPTLVGNGSRYILPVDGPVATPPIVSVGGTVRPASSYRLQHDRGVVYLNKVLPYTVAPGDAYSVGGHTVYTGIVAELQAYINAVCVAAGVTVRVVAPTPQRIQLSLNMVGTAGTDLVALRATIRRAIVAFVARLAPGEPLLMYRLVGALNNIPGVTNIVFDQSDVYPGSPKHKLTASLADIAVR